VALDLPAWVKNRPLTGTAPVVKWAVGIRLKKATDIQKMGVRVIMLAMRPHLKEEDFEAMNCTTDKRILQLVHAVAIATINCPEAAWWVAHRDEAAHTWIKEAWFRCRDHYIQTKPWG
jgi:hypothetical protein